MPVLIAMLAAIAFALGASPARAQHEEADQVVPYLDASDLSTPVDSLFPEGFDLLADARKEELNLQLVIAVDVSSSIADDKSYTYGVQDRINEYDLQKRGIVDVLKDRQVQQALEKCADPGIAITYVEWAGMGEVASQVRQVVPWRKIVRGAELSSFADEVRAEARAFYGWTDIAAALAAAARFILESPYRSGRAIINMSGDGDQTYGTGFRRDAEGMHALLARTRDKIVAAGITINGLVIEQDSRTDRTGLQRYYQGHVQGGYGSFTEVVSDFNDYARGFKESLMHELMTCGS